MSNDIHHDKNLDDPQTWKESGNEFFNKGQYEEAIKCYGHAIQLDPNYIDAWNNMGLSLLKIGKIEEAKECNERVKRLKTGQISHASHSPPPISPIKNENFSTTNQSKTYDEIKKQYESGEISYDQFQKLINSSLKTVEKDNRVNIGSAEDTTKSESKFCNYCGAELKFRDAEICPNCGMRLRGTTKQIIHEEKNPGIAALCSFFIPGLGQIYNGDVGKGIAFLFGTLIGALFLFIPGLIIWIFGMYDAYKTSKRMNSGEIPYKSTNTVAMILFGIIGAVLIIIFVIIVAAIIAAFVFGLAGTSSSGGFPSSGGVTSSAKNVGLTVSIDNGGIGKITLQGGTDLPRITAMYYSIDNGEFYPVKATTAGSSAPIASNFASVGNSVYTGESILEKRLIIKSKFNDGSEQIVFDKKF